MRKVECDACGGNSFKQVGGMYECIFCGAKYAIDDEGADREVVEAKVIALWEEAKTLNLAGQYKEELEILAKALELDKGNPKTLLKLGECYCGLDLLEKAADCYEKALELDPGMSKDVGLDYAGLGNLYLIRGDQAAAQSYHEKARSLLDPDTLKWHDSGAKMPPEVIEGTNVNDLIGAFFQGQKAANPKPKSKWKEFFS